MANRLPIQPIDSRIEVLEGTDTDAAWDRFEVFEALHHTMQICNPMTSAQVDEAVTVLNLTDGSAVFDVACGYGEFLFRCGESATIDGVGIDLSPWMITRAQELASTRAPASNLRWVLGEARDYVPPVRPDVAICVGAEWVWHDFNGTARALAAHLQANAGGVAVIGAARLHHGADRDQVASQRGRIETIDDMARMLEDHDLEPLHRIDPDDAGWDDYLARTATAAAGWNTQHPGPRAEKWLEEQRDWHDARERDREVIGWSLWIAEKRQPRA